jgi:hypothetical protein
MNNIYKWIMVCNIINIDNNLWFIHNSSIDLCYTNLGEIITYI